MKYHWKKVAGECFKKLCIMHDKFTGSLKFNVNQGAICDIQKEERIVKPIVDDETNEFEEGMNG